MIDLCIFSHTYARHTKRLAKIVFTVTVNVFVIRLDRCITLCLNWTLTDNRLRCCNAFSAVLRKVAKLTLIDCNQIVITIAFDGRIHLITLQTYKRLLSRRFTMKVAVIGAAGGIGQALALLLKTVFLLVLISRCMILRLSHRVSLRIWVISQHQLPSKAMRVKTQRLRWKVRMWFWFLRVLHVSRVWIVRICSMWTLVLWKHWQKNCCGVSESLCWHYY